MVRGILILLIRGYQKLISPALATFIGPAGRCRFEPSCSHYALESVQRHGAVAGSVLAARRLCRCHPWGAHGDDPVPEHVSFSLRPITTSKIPHGHGS